MNSARREALGAAPPPADAHAGLVRDRCLRAHKEMPGAWDDKTEPTPEEFLLQRLAGIAPSEAYRRAFARWTSLAEARGWLLLTAASTGPLAVGLGNASPLEVGLSIHHTYGMPVIPGSSIKGVLRRAATKAGLAQGSPEFSMLFGDPKNAAGCVFWDAWYDPRSVEGKPFHRDVITVHHQKYYSTKGKTPPTDCDDPNPVPFLVVRRGARFLFSIECHTPEWANYVRSLLEWALSHLGLGAKTNAGYGRFEVESYPSRGPDLGEINHAAVTSTSAPAVESTDWPGVTVHRNPGDGVLSASSGNQTARATGADAQRLLASLPDGLRAILLDKKKKSIRADIRVLRSGNAWRIAEIIEPETET